MSYLLLLAAWTLGVVLALAAWDKLMRTFYMVGRNVGLRRFEVVMFTTSIDQAIRACNDGDAFYIRVPLGREIPANVETVYPCREYE